jgi:hypothetical protein
MARRGRALPVRRLASLADVCLCRKSTMPAGSTCRLTISRLLVRVDARRTASNHSQPRTRTGSRPRPEGARHGRVDAINRGMDKVSPLASVEIPSLEGRVSEEEWKVRVDLAAAYRMVAYYGWDDLIFTHLSARVPGPDHHFLLNPYNLMFEEVTASSLVKVDQHGNPVEPTPFITNPAGFTIHSALHMGRADAHAVMHLHTPQGQAVSAHAEGLLPLTQTAMLVRGRDRLPRL